jgi:hypothetical protein
MFYLMAVIERQGLLVVLDPTVGEDVRTLSPAARLDTLRGKRVGMMSNGKPMADVFLRHLGALLEGRHGIEWELATKADPSRIAPRELLDSLAAKSHAIITGVGD